MAQCNARKTLPLLKMVMTDDTTNSHPCCTPTFSNLVLDTAAWVLNWLASVGSYAGRQERPWRRPRDEPLDDLPKIYIPNELTGNEIVRALKLTGKEQMVVEENEVKANYQS